jgi:YVTN family beta-propeller protein
MTLSHDGTTLVTCNSFDNTISIIDTGTWAVVKTLVVGAFPVRAAFSSDDERIYVSSRDDDTIKIVDNAGVSSSVIGSILVGNEPFEMVVASDGSRLYVANFGGENIGVVDLASNLMTNTIATPDPPLGLAIDATESSLFAATGTWSVSFGPGPFFSIAKSGQFCVIDLDSETIIEQANTGLPPAMLDVDATFAAIPSPFGDGVTLVNGMSPTGVQEPAEVSGIDFAGPFPNPMRDHVTFVLMLNAPASAGFTIHDSGGRLIAVREETIMPAARFELLWDGRDARGARVPPGVYFARLTVAGAPHEGKKLIVVR